MKRAFNGQTIAQKPMKIQQVNRFPALPRVPRGLWKDFHFQVKEIAALFILFVSATQAVGQARNISSNSAPRISNSSNVYSAPAERNTYQPSYSNTSQHSAQRTEVTHTAAPNTASYRYTSGAAGRASVSAPNSTYAAMSARPYAGYSSGAGTTASVSYSNPISAPGNAARYNYVSKQTYPCFSADETRHKSHRHECDSVHICPPPLLLPCYAGNADLSYYYLSDYCNYIYDWYFLDKCLSQPEQTAQLKSFDGYLIYGYDTMSGIITMDKQRAYLEQPVHANKEDAATVEYKDKNLKGIVLFAGRRQLHLTKLPGESGLRRVLHSGKLLICDASFNFPTPANVHHTTITVSDPAHNTQRKIHSKKQLVTQINKTYGTSLEADSYSWTKLFELIDKLP